MNRFARAARRSLPVGSVFDTGVWILAFMVVGLLFAWYRLTQPFVETHVQPSSIGASATLLTAHVSQPTQLEGAAHYVEAELTALGLTVESQRFTPPKTCLTGWATGAWRRWWMESGRWCCDSRATRLMSRRFHSALHCNAAPKAPAVCS